jgi:nicotinamidase-related amidase
MPDFSLIDVDDSVFIAVDVQDNFTSKLAPEQLQPLLERVCWLARVAAWCRVPLIVTVEDMARRDSLAPELAASLPPDVPIFDKLIFGLADQPDILEAVEITGRKTIVLAGLETDVCVMQSALGLQARGFRPVVISDATCSPGDSHAAGLARLREAGILITDTKGLFYEWMRTLERARKFGRENPSLKTPTGLIL